MTHFPLNNERMSQADTLMGDFLQRTHASAQGVPRRYLWTDAFALCNLLSLAGRDGKDKYAVMTRQLIDEVHHTLGRYRPDDSRHGWLSGLDEAQGREHPTRGGLRIGKELPERPPNEPFDERREWHRDGQYFHYLTKWMHALDQASHFFGEERYNRWARELADTAWNRFVYRPSASAVPRMYWKMSTDLTRPLVPAMGQHDPLDGYVTCIQLHSSAQMRAYGQGPDLQGAIEDFTTMLAGENWVSTDALGLGGLLVDAHRCIQLAHRGVEVLPGLTESLLEAAGTGLHYYSHSEELQIHASYRLAFRELGLAIGLEALRHALDNVEDKSLKSALAALEHYLPLRDSIVSFWSDPQHQQVASWHEHRDINSVMLATAQLPRAFIDLY